MTNSTQKSIRATEKYSNKVFQTLAYLSEDELKRLEKYLQSPYFIQSRLLPILCGLLIKELEKGHEGFNRRIIWQKLYPNDPYDDVSFRKLCSDLLKHIQDFMVHESINTDPIQKAIELLNFVVDHKIEPLYKSTLRDVRDIIETPHYRSPQHFRAGYLLEDKYFSMMDFGMTVDQRANLEEISNYLDLSYWIEKLKLGSTALSQQRARSQEYDIKFIDEITTYLSIYPVDEVPGLAIYYYFYQALKEEENVEHYFKLKMLLDQYSGLIPQMEAIELIDSALQYCSRKINKGVQSFNQEFFELFEDALAKGVFIVKGELATWRFNNMIAAALRLGKLEWAENFITTYYELLPIDSRNNTYSFNLARVYRYQGKFENVLGLLRDVDYQDIGYNLISKTIMTITYYELGQFDVLSSFLSAFRVFLDRNKKVPYKDLHLNLIKYTRRLIRLKPGDKIAKDKLREEITREKSKIVNHEWLLEKLS